MTKKLASLPGVGGLDNMRNALLALVRCAAVTLVLAASSAAHAQIEVSVTAQDDTASEAPDGGLFVVTATEPVDVETNITYMVSGSATEGADYATLTGVTIAAGGTEAAIPVNVPGDDALLEGSETVTVTLQGSDNLDVSVSSTPATVMIEDSTYAVTASNFANASEDPVSAGAIRVTLDATNESGSPLTVDYSIAGTATVGVDYQTLSGTVDIPVGAGSADITITPIDDDDPDDGETVALTLTNTSDTGVTIGNPASATVTINDNDQDPNAEVVVSVSANRDTTREASGPDGEFVVQRVGGSERQVTINYSVGGTATPGDDYTQLSGTVTLAENDDQESINVSPNEDGAFEGDETVQITLLGVQDQVTVDNATATVTIIDTDHSVTATRVSNASEKPLGVGRIRVSLGAQNQSGQPLTVQYSTGGTADAGVDYVTLSGSVDIPVNSSSADIDVTPIDDTEDEGQETVLITLTGTSNPNAPVGKPGSADLVIADGQSDNVEVMLSIEASDANASERTGNNGAFLVTRVGGSDRAVTVNYSIGGSASPGADYAALSGSVNLAQNQNSASIPVNVTGQDGLFEGEETVALTLQEVPGQISVIDDSATVRIADSDYTVAVTLTTNAGENPLVPGEVVITLNALNDSGSALGVNYTVAGTATAGADYVALNGTALIADGSNSASIVVTPIDDNLLEDAETVDVTLTGTSDGGVSVADPSTGSVSIADDDSGNDDDADGVENDVECPDTSQCRDTDNDGIPDFQDPDDDGDGVRTASEGAPTQDTDTDTIPDYLDTDDDGDGRSTASEDANLDGDGDPSTNPTDLDGDTIPDYLDADDSGGPTGDLDGDGLTNDEEAALGTDPQLADTDGDGVNDGAEVTADTDPLDALAFADADADLVPDAVEAGDGTDPNDPESFLDSDGGGSADHVETITYASYGLAGTNVNDATDDSRDLDGDGLPDRLEISIGANPDGVGSPTSNGAGDEDGDGITNAVETYLAMAGIPSVNRSSDQDRDGYPDAREVALGLNPLTASERDGDGDGIPDIIEALAGLDIDATTDSDGDGIPDAREIGSGSDFLDANSPIVNGALDDDGDAVSNGIEAALEALGITNVDANTDTDEDGITDADEIRLGTDPLHDEQPAAWIELSRDNVGTVSALTRAGGMATATAVVAGHQTGTLVYDWGDSDNAILAVTSGGQTSKTLRLSPQTLPAGNYLLSVKIGRNVGSYSSPLSVVDFVVVVHADGDPADFTDADGDGINDSADNFDARTGFANELPARSGVAMQAEKGVRLQLGTTARGARVGTARVSAQDVANFGSETGESVGNSDDAFDYTGGIYDFRIAGLPEVGDAVRVVIPLASAIAEFPEYRKYRSGSGWGKFVEDDDNHVESAAGSNQGCPEPGDGSYGAGLTPGHFCVQLTIEDGGPNDGDADLGPNGIIEDPSGVATPEGEVKVNVGSGGGGTAPVAVLVLALLALMRAAMVRRRRRSAPRIPELVRD